MLHRSTGHCCEYQIAAQMHVMLSVWFHLRDRRFAHVCCTLCCLLSNGSHACAPSIALLTYGAASLSLQVKLGTVHRAAISTCISLLKLTFQTLHLLSWIAVSSQHFMSRDLGAHECTFTMLCVTQRSTLPSCYDTWHQALEAGRWSCFLGAGQHGA